MRSVCFGKCIEFPSFGNVYKNGITLGDVDNDGHIELIVGNMDGTVHIFKERTLIQEITGLGMITAMGVGDILNCGSNALVIVCGDGWCHIYLCLSKNTEEETLKLQPIHVQRIPANTKVLLLTDIDGDGNVELILGLTDRVVRCYRWMHNISGGRLLCSDKWECADQIGNISLNYETNKQPCLLISQPGGTFMRIKCSVSDKDSGQMTVDYQPLTSRRMRNPGITSIILGNVATSRRPVEASSPYVIATLDGTLMYVQDDEIKWSIQVDHQLFALGKMDVTASGCDSVITCSWEGHTYILDQDKNSIQFHLEQPVSAFCAGLYTVHPNEPPTPCLIYLTFSKKLYVYYDIHFSSVTISNLQQYLGDKVQQGIDQVATCSSDNRSKKRLVSWCLYGNHTSTGINAQELQ